MNRVFALSTAALLAPVTAEAGVSGWIWNSCPTSSCIPDPLYQANSSGAQNEVTRVAAGTYEVRMPGIAVNGGTAQVSAYNTDGHCQIEGWFPSGADQLVNVACFDTAGNRADSFFDLLFYDHGNWLAPNPTESAYAWANDASNPASYFPSPSYRYNSAGGRISVQRIIAGEYHVTVPRVRARNVVAMVSAYGSTAARCQAVDWFASGASLLVMVECTDLLGTPTDSRFVLGVSAGEPPADADSNLAFQGAGIRFDYSGNVDRPKSWYAVPGHFDFEVTRTSVGTGSYDVLLPGLADLYDTFLVTTSSGSSGDRCNIGYWWNDGVDTTVHVDCYDALGASIDSGFTLLWQTSSP